IGNCSKMIVIGTFDVIDPCIRGCHLMEREISARRQVGIVSVDLPDPENARGSATVPFGLSQAAFVLAGQAAAPGEAMFSEKHRPRRRGSFPFATRRAFE